MSKSYATNNNDEVPLTNRETQVLRHVALGLSNKEIGRSLTISNTALYSNTVTSGIGGALALERGVLDAQPHHELAGAGAIARVGGEYRRGGEHLFEVFDDGE